MAPTAAVPLAKPSQESPVGINAILLGPPGSGKGTQVRVGFPNLKIEGKFKLAKNRDLDWQKVIFFGKTFERVRFPPPPTSRHEFRSKLYNVGRGADSWITWTNPTRRVLFDLV